MKKVVCILLLLVVSLPFVNSCKAETVSKMPYTAVLPDGATEGVYTGETTDGIPNGYGVFSAVDSFGLSVHYLGQWENGKMHGDGGFYYDNGYSMVGTFENNAVLCGFAHLNDSPYFWGNFKPNDHGCCEIIEYRADGSKYFEGCVNQQTMVYHKGTIYTKDGEVIFSGEIGEGFNWDYFK